MPGADLAEELERPKWDLFSGRHGFAPGGELIPPVDVFEGSGEYLIKVDLPGLQKNDLRVVRERDALVITGSRRKEDQERWYNLLRIERPHGTFVRRFALPDDASRGRIKARLADGVLQIHVRRASLGKPEPVFSPRLEVEIN